MSTFGKIYTVTTFGESHGVGVGCVIDNCPPGLELDDWDIDQYLQRRKPGQSSLVTQRIETDKVEILSGVENSITIGTPIALVVRNENIRRTDYINLASIPRPGHADYTYFKKYNGYTVNSGGGRSSGRETIGRVCGGAIAQKWLWKYHKTLILSMVTTVYDVSIPEDILDQVLETVGSQKDIDLLGSFYKSNYDSIYRNIKDKKYYSTPEGKELLELPKDLEDTEEIFIVRCPHIPTALRMINAILNVKKEGDSCGGIVTTIIRNVPRYIGEPVFDKFPAKLAHGILSLPAVKGFEFGDGFRCVKNKGSIQNDRFVRIKKEYIDTTELKEDSKVDMILESETNHSGGTLGGITLGGDIIFRVAFKPASSISSKQRTMDYNGNLQDLVVNGRHDPCFVPRTPPVVEAMTALVIMDLTLMQSTRRQ